MRLIIPPEDQGQRADRVLARLVPELGLRGRRRLCEGGRALLDGRAVGPAAKVRRGQELALLPEAGAEEPVTEAALPVRADGGPRLLRIENGLAALYKPAGLHSAALAGGGGASLEALLPRILGGSCPDPFPFLLNRLDAGTSGLVLAALDADGERLWRTAETQGTADKRYLAVVVGQPGADFVIRRALDTDRRARTRVLERDADVLRHTEVVVLRYLTGAEAPDLAGAGAVAPEPAVRLALVGCRIRKGARHQIRAHLAAAGHPLFGDALYGGGSGTFFLHHGACGLPGFSAACPPFWEPLLPREAALRGRNWLALMRGMVYSTSKSS